MIPSKGNNLIGLDEKFTSPKKSSGLFEMKFDKTFFAASFFVVISLVLIIRERLKSTFP